MSVESRHPSITAERSAEWQLTRDAVDGESQIKARGETYLSKPSGFKSLPDQGRAAYAAYKMRGQFPEILAPSIASMIGIIHSKEVDIQMPDALKNVIWERATNSAHPMTLEAFHRRITRNLLTIGRFATLADAPPSGGDPFLVGYDGDALINWDENFFVVDECSWSRVGFDWVWRKQYRTFELIDGAYVQTIYSGIDLEQGQVVPTASGGKSLDVVPFSVASAVDLSPRIITPPLIGVSRAALAIYQLSADYRWQLYMSGQETLVVINGQKPTAVGAGVVIELRGGDGQTPDAKYVSPSCSGIDAHLKAIEDNRKAAINAGARLFEGTSTAQESGEARKLRFTSETATLLSIAQASAGLLEKGLRDCARFMGLNPDDVVVTPPANLMDQEITPAEFSALFDVYERGGMAWETYYAAGTRGGIFSPERDADEEYALIDGQGGDTDPEVL